MSSAKRFLFIALSFVVATVTFAAFTPRAVHAITAALVQVTNTSANPVPMAESSIRYEASVCSGRGAISAAVGTCPDGQNTFVVPTVTSSGAAVKRLIVDNVSGFCSTYANPNLFLKVVQLTGPVVPDSDAKGSAQLNHFVPIVAPPFSYVNDANQGVLANVQETDYAYGQTTHFAFLPGDTVRLGFFFFFASGNFDGNCIARIDGYLVTQ